MTMAVEHPDEVASVPQDENLGRPVRIMWVDSGLMVHGWKHDHELPDDVQTVETVGLWMGENDNVVMVGASRDLGNESWLGAQLIWKASIKSKEFLG